MAGTVQQIRFTRSLKSQRVFSHVDEAHFQSADGARTYLIQVGVPKAEIFPKPDAGYPVLFMLDGNAVFDELMQFLPERLPPAVIVGVGYDESMCDVVESRSVDYTPPIAGVEDLRDPRVPSRRAGGADLFLDILQNELLPVVAERYFVNLDKRIFYGHSYGGLCVLHALFTRPGLFKHWISISPSVWWHDHYINQELQNFMQRPLLSQEASLLLMVGNHEQLRQRQEETVGIPTLGWGKSLAEQLKKRPDLNICLGLRKLRVY